MKEIEFAKGYLISEDGRVFSIKRNSFLKPHLSNSGKHSVLLMANDGTRKKAFIHRLVATAYIDNPMNKPQVDHIDGDNSNNNVSNLRWCTNEENQMFREEQGNSGKEGISKVVIYDGITYPSIRNLTRILAKERGSKEETIRKAIKNARHGSIMLYGKHLSMA